MMKAKAYCPECHIDEELHQEAASRLVVYHNALFDCAGEAVVKT